MKNNKVLIVSIAIVILAVIAVGITFVKVGIQSGESNNIKDDQEIDVIAKENTPEGIFQAFNENRFDDAISQAQVMLETDSNNEDILLSLASAYLQKGSLEFKEQEYGKKGLEIINGVINLNPKLSKAYFLKGYAYEIMGEYDNALVAYSKSLELKKTTEIYNQIGHLYDIQGDTDKAKEFYGEAYLLDSQSIGVLTNLGRVYIRESAFEKADEIYTQIIESALFSRRNNRAKAEVYHAFSQIKLQSNDIENALEYAKKAMAADEKFPLAYVQVAQLEAMFNQDYEKAMNLIDKALLLNSNQTAAYELRGMVYLEQNKYMEAEDSFKQAISTVDGDITIMDNRRGIIKSKNQQQLSIVQALNNKPKEAYDNLLLAMVHMSKGVFEDILSDIKSGNEGPYAILMTMGEFTDLRDSLMK